MGKILLWILLILTGLILLGVGIYYMGPKPKYETVNAYLPSLEVGLDSLDEYIAKEEALVPNIKPNNEAYVVWADSFRKTPYVFLYLHGFSASPAEGDPLHKDLAKRYGSNLYVPRLEGHGIDDKESFGELTPMNYMNSAKKAIATARLLGDTLILISCSTGGTLSAYLAAEHPELVHALVMYSPNFSVANPFMPLVTGPWGKEILTSVVGSEYRDIPGFAGKEEAKYWTSTYRIEGLMAVQALIDQTSTKEVFNKIDIPYYIGYWYKNEEEKDNTISIDAIKYFDKHTKTPKERKRVETFPNVGAHVMTSSLRSKDLGSVEESTFKFFEEVLGIQPIMADSVEIDQSK
ncbi:MAG: alpha/beta hydrolase [Bacteroidia bacterium]|nr:alpha/beta hydrolase [Bacteroidia bacterium]